MSVITRYGASQMLLSVFAPDVALVPTTLWVALTSTVPLPESTGDTLIEPTTGSYSRASVTTGSANWTLDGMSTLMNVNEIAFPVPTADWGRLQGWALTTASTGGLVIAAGPLNAAAYVVSGSAVTIAANTVRIRMEF